MKFFKKPIFTGFMPNLTLYDVRVAASFVLPWKWREINNGLATEEVTKILKKYFSAGSAFTFDSGRSALCFALQALGVQKGDEVLVQAFTCGVVSNAILWSNGTPIYVDIKEDFTLDPTDLEKKITPHSKVLIIQHTFGISADITKLLAIAQKYNLKIIEDCAHVLGGKYKNKFLGTWGDIGMLSFGSDKALSCGRGGALITNHPDLAQKIKSLQAVLKFPPLGVTLKQLVTFIIFAVCKPLYNLGIGKWLLAGAKKIHALSRIIEQPEKQGRNLPFYPARFSNALAAVLLSQWKQLDKFNATRWQWAQAYHRRLKNFRFPFVSLGEDQENVFLLRFPLLVSHPNSIHQLAKKEGIMLGDWYHTPVAPKDFSHRITGYRPGSCPRVEQYAKQVVNLPTHYSLTVKDFNRIVTVLQMYERSRNPQ